MYHINHCLCHVEKNILCKIDIEDIMNIVENKSGLLELLDKKNYENYVIFFFNAILYFY